MNLKIITCFFLLVFISACDEKIYTVDDFKNSKSLTDEYLSKCSGGELHPEDINCINVKKSFKRKF